MIFFISFIIGFFVETVILCVLDITRRKQS